MTTDRFTTGDLMRRPNQFALCAGARIGRLTTKKGPTAFWTTVTIIVREISANSVPPSLIYVKTRLRTSGRWTGFSPRVSVCCAADSICNSTYSIADELLRAKAQRSGRPFAQTTIPARQIDACFQQNRAFYRWRQSLCNRQDARLRHRLQAPSQGIPEPRHASARVLLHRDH